MNVLTRHPDWRPRLAKYVIAEHNRKFRPGEYDCALFVAGAVMAMTGFDFGAEWRGKYRTLKEGYAAARAAGFEDHVAIFAEICPLIEPAFAQVGDIAILPDPNDEKAMGIVQGEYVYALHPTGMVIANRMEMTGALRV